MTENIIGIDLGGTMVKIGIVDPKNGILKKDEIETKIELGFERVVERICQKITEIVDISNVRAVGVGSPGSIDHDKGIIKFSPNFPDWNNVPLKTEIEKHLRLSVFIENDANSAALGEKWFGEGKGKDHIVVLTLGTGIGGGVITHGKLLTGNTGIGAELGHMIVDPHGPICGCGNYGCLEAMASATALIRYANEGRKRFPESKIFELEKRRGVLGAREIFDAYRLKDRLATRIFETFVEAMSVGITSIIHIFNPQVVILGGGMSKSADLFIPKIREKVDMRTIPSFLGTFEIVGSKLGNDAGILGAAAVALENL
ncbi:MAG: ROK family protein [Thermotogae bacterium]|nr:ROK family protein [Thermotogota bacterium]